MAKESQLGTHDIRHADSFFEIKLLSYVRKIGTFAFLQFSACCQADYSGSNQSEIADSSGFKHWQDMAGPRIDLCILQKS